MIIQCQFRMNISRDKQDFWSKVWQQKLCDLRISRGRFFTPYFGGQKLDLYAEKYGTEGRRPWAGLLVSSAHFFIPRFYFPFLYLSATIAKYLLLNHLRPIKKNNWLASFFQKFYGREGGFYFWFFKIENIIKHIPTYCRPGIQVFRFRHTTLERRKHKFSGN